MDSSEVKNLIGKKVIGFKHCFVDEKGTRQDWLVETIEAIGPDWVVTRGRHPSLTWVWVDNICEGLQKEILNEGEQGQPINEAQFRALTKRMAETLAVDGVTIQRLESFKEAKLFDDLDAYRRLCLHYCSGGKPTD